MVTPVGPDDVFGLIRSAVDAHTLGVTSVAELIRGCGVRAVIAEGDIVEATGRISEAGSSGLLTMWIRRHHITRLGFSYRLDPQAAQLDFGRVYRMLRDRGLLAEDGGPVMQVYFAGLPDACHRIRAEYRGRIPVFTGDESQTATLVMLGIRPELAPSGTRAISEYDEDRRAFAASLIEAGGHEGVQPTPPPTYPEFGTRSDGLVARLRHRQAGRERPLIRAHLGPYSADAKESLAQFQQWVQELSIAGYLDVLSVATSQLSQEAFGADWAGRPNGGGLPVNSEQDLADIWTASRPMLVRAYSATSDVASSVPMFERTVNMAWHTLSLWWFNQIDGRGPNSVLEGLRQHLEAISAVASFGKPFEANTSHHFAFRGADDYTYVLSTYLAAVVAKRRGIRHFVLQTMLNTPRHTHGAQDLAKARALLRLVRGLEDSSFVVLHQPRAGLDYFSSDLESARIQLADVTCLMDDIEATRPDGPDLIHVVSYCEGVELATPAFVNESVQITLHALESYRRAKREGLVGVASVEDDVEERTTYLCVQVRETVRLMESAIPDLYSARGLYEVFRSGIFAVPYLWECRDEFRLACGHRTGLVSGGVHVVDASGAIAHPVDRVAETLARR